MLANRLIGLARGGGGVNEDTFDTDSTSQYTQYADVNATWSIASGELTATGGYLANFIRNGTSYTDVVIEADINHTYNGGLVARFVDNNNYYMLVTFDDSGGFPPHNFEIYKRVGGTLTRVAGPVNISWPRGTSKNIRFAVSGSTLTGYADGVQVITATDSAIAGPGGVGMRNHQAGQQSKYQAFRWGL